MMLPSTTAGKLPASAIPLPDELAPLWGRVLSRTKRIVLLRICACRVPKPPVTLRPALNMLTTILFSNVTALLMRMAAPAPFTKVQLRITLSGDDTQICSVSGEAFRSMNPSLSYLFTVRRSKTKPSTMRPVWSPFPSRREPCGVVFESAGQARRLGVFQGSRCLKSRSQLPRRARYGFSTTHFPLFSFPPYSPCATLMRSPGSAFSRAWNGSLKGFSREPRPQLSRKHAIKFFL